MVFVKATCRSQRLSSKNDPNDSLTKKMKNQR
jgi:hypothetical protein